VVADNVDVDLLAEAIALPVGLVDVATVEKISKFVHQIPHSREHRGGGSIGMLT